MKKAVIYAKHIYKRRNQKSAYEQYMYAEEYARENNIEVIEKCFDCVPTTNSVCVQFERLLKNCANAEWNTILVYSITLFGRDLDKTLKLKKQLKAKNINLVFMDWDKNEIVKLLGGDKL